MLRAGRPRSQDGRKPASAGSKINRWTTSDGRAWPLSALRTSAETH
jgi:hypothetical protein